jgi:hypothetical protein
MQRMEHTTQSVVQAVRDKVAWLISSIVVFAFIKIHGTPPLSPSSLPLHHSSALTAFHFLPVIVSLIRSGDGDENNPIYKKATTMPAAPRRAGMAVAMAPLSEAAELTLLAALLAALEALLETLEADLEALEALLAALLEAELMSLETLLEMLLATELADEEMEEMSEEAEPVRELRMEPGIEC